MTSSMIANAFSLLRCSQIDCSFKMVGGVDMTSSMIANASSPRRSQVDCSLDMRL